MPINRFVSRFALVLGLVLLLPGFLAAQEKAPAFDTIATTNGDLKIYPINHATFVMVWQGKTVYMDPVGGAAAFKGLPAPDLILVTHIHGDHFSAPTIAGVAGDKTLFGAPPTVAAQFPSNLAARVTVMTNGQTHDLDGIGVEAVPAYNITAARLKNHPKGRDNGYVLSIGGKRIYVSGDTEDVPEMLSLKSIDIAFICMNSPTMDEQHAANAVKAFKPRIVYPYHYKGSDLEKFKALVGDEPGVEVRLRNWYPAKPAP